MADNTRRNIQEEKEYLDLQKQISEAAKNAGKSWEAVGDYTKTVAANYVEMQRLSAKIRDINKEIKKIGEATTDEEKERLKLLQQQVQLLNNERDQILSINKQMVSGTKLLTMGFSGIVTYIGNALTGYLQFSQKVKDTAATIGLGSNNMWMMQKNIEQASVEMLRYGVTQEQALEAQQAYSEELGRTVLLSQDAMKNMAEIGKATGLGMQGVAGMAAQMEAFGFGAEKATDYIYEVYSEAAAMGLNAGKVTKKFEQNLGLLNKLNFKNGVNGLKEMAKFSEKYKLDMQSVASVADKVFRPEGAIEAAAQLQVLGGSLATLGDPFTLMYKARNAPEELTKSIAKAAAASGEFNKETGEFVINAYEMDRMKEASQALGLSMEDMVKTAKQTAKLNMFEGMLGTTNLKPEDKEALAMMTEMKNGKAQIQIGLNDDGSAKFNELSKMTEQDLLNVINQKKDSKKAAEQATGILDRISNFMNQLLTAIYPLFSALEEYFTPLIQDLTETTTGWAKDLTKFFTTLDPKQLFNDIKEFFLGIWDKLKWMGENWKSVLGWGAAAFVAIWVGSQIPAALSFAGTVAGVLGGFFSGIISKFTGGITSGVTGGLTSALGSAVQILAMGAALMMVAKALDIFGDAMLKLNQVPAGLLVGVGIGLLTFVGALGVLGGTGVGPIAVEVLLGIGAGMLMIGGAVWLASQGISAVVDSFTKMFTVVGDGGSQLFLAGTGFLMMAAGIGVLTASLIALSATSLLAIPGLMVLGATSMMIVNTAESLAKIGTTGLKDSIDAINKVDTDKLEALKDLSLFMSLLGATTTIKFDETLKINGSIELTGEAGGKTNTDWINDPIFVRKIKQVIENSKVSDKNGGRT